MVDPMIKRSKGLSRLNDCYRFLVILFFLTFGLAASDFVVAQPPQGQGGGRDAQMEEYMEKQQAGSGPPQGVQGRSGPPSDDQSGDDYEMEMMNDDMGDDDMGDGYGGGRGGPPRRGPAPGAGGSPQEAILRSYQESFASLMGGLDLTPLMADPAQFGGISTGPVLGGDAESAYRGGNHELAMQLYYAHMVTEFDQARVNLQTAKYSRLLRRPVWQIRWGVSYAIHGDTSVSDPSPILAGKTPQGTGNSRRGGGRGRGDEQGLDDFDDEEMNQGDDQYDDEMSMDDDDMGMDEGRGGGQQRGRQAAMAMSMAPPRTMLDPSANEVLDKYLGLVAKTVADEFSKRYQQGDFGTAMCTLNAPAPDLEVAGGAPPVRGKSPVPVGRPRGPVDDLLDSSPETPPLWIPGVVFLGEGDFKEMVKAASSDGVELLLHFDVALKTNRNDEVQNTSRCKLLNVATGKALASSKGLDSLEIEQLARAGRSNETTYVNEGLASLFMIMDRQAKASDMPKLSPEVAKRRVGTLLAATGTKRLRALAEIRLYEAQGLISPEDVELAFHIMGGQEGLAILHGATEQKLKVAREWSVEALPRSRDDG